MKANRETEQFYLNKENKKEITVLKEGKILNKNGKEIGHLKNDGYCKVSLRDNKKERVILIHRLVYLVHKGNIPDNYIVHHKDGNKLNNNIDNLEAITEKEHGRHTKLLGI